MKQESTRRVTAPITPCLLDEMLHVCCCYIESTSTCMKPHRTCCLFCVPSRANRLPPPSGISKYSQYNTQRNDNMQTNKYPSEQVRFILRLSEMAVALECERRAQCAFKLISMDSAEQHDAARRWAIEASDESSNKTKNKRLVLGLGEQHHHWYSSTQPALLVLGKHTEFWQPRAMVL